MPFLLSAAAAAPPFAPVCLVVPLYLDDLPRFQVFMASVTAQSLMPLQLQLVLNTPHDREYNGAFFEPNAKTLSFANMTGLSNWPAEGTEQEALRNLYESFGAPPISAAFGKVPSIKFWIRTGIHSYGDNRRFGAAQCAPGAELISFFTASDILHPDRIHWLWRSYEQLRDKSEPRSRPLVFLHDADIWHYARDRGVNFDGLAVDRADATAVPGVVDYSAKINILTHMGMKAPAALVQVPSPTTHCEWLTVSADALKSLNLLSEDGVRANETDQLEPFVGAFLSTSSHSIYHIPKKLGVLLDSASNDWRSPEKLKRLTTQKRKRR